CTSRSSADAWATSLSGIVSDRPRQDSSKAASAVGKVAVSTCRRPYSQSSPSRSYAAACRRGDLLCEIGSPHTASRVRGPTSAAGAGVRLAPGAHLRDALLVLFVGGGELRLAGGHVDRHEVQPRAVSRMHGGIDRRVAGVGDRRLGEPFDHVGVPGVVVVLGFFGGA